MESKVGRAVETFREAIDEHVRVIESLSAMEARVDEAAAKMAACLEAGGKILWMGNGGSAADSQHLAAELVGRFTRERKGLASIALTVDTSILTAIGNDYGYDAVFSRQVEALCRPGDVLVGISTSGRSANVLAAMRTAREIGGVFRIAMTGATGGTLAGECELLFNVGSPITARVQEGHLFLGHRLCDMVEAACAGEGAG